MPCMLSTPLQSVALQQPASLTADVRYFSVLLMMPTLRLGGLNSLVLLPSQLQEDTLLLLQYLTCTINQRTNTVSKTAQNKKAFTPHLWLL